MKVITVPIKKNKKEIGDLIFSKGHYIILNTERDFWNDVLTILKSK